MSPEEARLLEAGDWVRWDSHRCRPRWRWFRIRRVEGGAVFLQPAEACILGDWGRAEDRVANVTWMADYTRVGEEQ